MKRGHQVGKSKQEEIARGLRIPRPNHRSIVADFRTWPAALFLRVLESVTQAGGALRFGRTRDGGTYAVGIYGAGPEPFTEYLRPGDNITEFLEWVEGLYGSPGVVAPFAGKGAPTD